MKYLLLKHYRGAPEAVTDVPMDQWTPGADQDQPAVEPDGMSNLPPRLNVKLWRVARA